MIRTKLMFAFIWALSATLAYSTDHGFPALNTVGRFLGVGWSHHTFHSQVDGRFDVVSNRHPACAYPSSALSYIYSPEYNNYPPRPMALPTSAGFWQPPTIVSSPSPTAAPKASILEPNNKPRKAEPKSVVEDLAPPEEFELPKPTQPPKPAQPPKPKEPPPSWLKPYLEEDKAKSNQGELIELEPSPSDKTTWVPAVNRYRR